MMKKVDCHALQGKARNDRKRASFLNTPQDFKTPAKDSRISKETCELTLAPLRLFCDEKTSEAVQGEAVAGFFSKSLLCEHSQGRALGCVTAESVKRSKIYRAKPNPPAKR